MKLNVAVFFGGESVEHEVSIISAHQAMEALDKEKYNVVPVYVAKDRKMYTSPLLWDISNYKDLSALTGKCEEIYLVQIGNKVVIRTVKTGLFKNPEVSSVDVAIPVMHGTNGEDGTIQGFFEMLKVPYAGCDITAAAVGQDKVQQKHILSSSGLPITRWFYCYGNDYDSHKEAIMNQVHEIGYPVILKPACTGSSVGISIAHNDEEYEHAFLEASQYDFKVITEKVVSSMREFNCAVLGDSFAATPSVIEEVFHGSSELLDFKDKYMGGGSKGSKGGTKGMASVSRKVPADIPEEIQNKIQEYALHTFKVLGCSGVCRVDVMMDDATKEIYINEINTIPGSLSFYLFEPTGIPFTELMDRLVKLALDKERRRSKMTFSYETNLLSSYSASGAKGSKGAKR